MPAYRPATQLEKEIGAFHKQALDRHEKEVIVPLGTLQTWHNLAKLVDARMRLDGSEKNKRKPKK